MSMTRHRHVLAALLSAGILTAPSVANPPENVHAMQRHGDSILIESIPTATEVELNEALACVITGLDGAKLEVIELADPENGHSENGDSELDKHESCGAPEPNLVFETVGPTPTLEATTVSVAKATAEPIKLTQEKIQERYPDGRIHIERWVTLDELGNFVNHGPWKQLDREGQVVKSGSWDFGQRDGQWVQTLNTAQASRLSTNLKAFQAPFTSTAQFKGGQLDGTWILADQRNKVVVSWDFAADQRNGVSVWFTPNGNKRLQINYIDNQPSGEMLVWNGSDDGPPKPYKLIDGMELKTETKWYGKTKRQKEEEFTYLVPSTMRIASQSWDASSLLYVESTDADPVRHGKYVRWYRNGVIAHQGSYQFGEPSGEAEWWHPNGQRQVVGSYVDGEPDGQWVWWHDNGMRKISGEYYAGTQVGLWRSWSAQGQLAAVEQKLESEQVIAAEQPAIEKQYSELEYPETRVSTAAQWFDR